MLTLWEIKLYHFAMLRQVEKVIVMKPILDQKHNQSELE